MKCGALLASRTEAVATVTIRSAPRASAIERKRLIQSTARSMAAGESFPWRKVSWPRRTMSFSRASTANESLAAASTTTSLIEFEPISMAAIFMCLVLTLLVVRLLCLRRFLRCAADINRRFFLNLIFSGFFHCGFHGCRGRLYVDQFSYRSTQGRGHPLNLTRSIDDLKIVLRLH